MGTHGSKSCSRLCQCDGEQLHQVFGRAEDTGFLTSLKDFSSKAITVSTSLFRIQGQAIFLWINAGFATSNNGKTFQAL